MLRPIVLRVRIARSAVPLVLMRTQNGDLLLDSLIIVKYLERSRRKFSCTIMSNELDLAVKLRLHRYDALLNEIFAFRLGTQT